MTTEEIDKYLQALVENSPYSLEQLQCEIPTLGQHLMALTHLVSELNERVKALESMAHYHHGVTGAGSAKGQNDKG